MATAEQRDTAINDLQVRVGVNEQKLDGLTHRVDANEVEIKEIRKTNEAILSLASDVKLLTQNYTTMGSDVKDMKQDIKDVKAKQDESNTKHDKDIEALKEEISETKTQPLKEKAEMWDKLKWLIIGGIASATLTGVIASIVNK